MSTFNDALFKLKWPLIIASLIFIGYCQAYYWIALPDELGISWRWQPDSQLKIVSVAARNEDLLQAGDIIKEVDGRQLVHTRPVFKPPVQNNYTFTIQREQEVHTVQVALPAAKSSPIMLSVLVGLVSCFAGSAILFTARSTDTDGLQIGAIFLFLGASFSGMTASQQGVPGAWLIGHVALAFCPLTLIRLGWLPKGAVNSKWLRPISRLLFVVSSLTALLAFIEVVWLYPIQKSWQSYSGISLIRSLYVLIALALLLFVCTVIVRAITTSPSYQKQQLRILSFFLIFAIFPAVFLTILPSMLNDTIVLPKMISFGLLGMGPIGYLYIINRRSSPDMDHWVGRAILFLLLITISFILYAAAAQLFFPQTQITIDYRLHALLLSTTLLAVFFVKSPLEQAVSWLIAGSPAFESEEIAHLSHSLSRNPESSTLQHFIERIAERFGIENSLLLLEEDLRHTKMIFSTGKEAEIIVPKQFSPFDKPLIKQDGISLFELMPWAGLILPLFFGGEQIGYYAVAPPHKDRYFSGRQIDIFVQLAEAIAIGSQAIFLFESVDILAAKTKQVRADEQAKLSKRLHSQPIQSLLAVKQILEISNPEGDKLLEKAVHNLQQVTDELRNISHDLRDSVIDKQLETIIYSVVRNFEALESATFVYVSTKDIHAFTPEGSVAFVVYEVLSEAFNNIYRHAQASEVWLHVNRCEHELIMTVSDNGIGLDQPFHISDLTRQGTGMGIVDMHSSVRSVGGKLSFEKNEHGGLTVHCTIPLQGIIVL